MDPPHDNPIPLNESTAADTNNITLQYKDLFLLFIRAVAVLLIFAYPATLIAIGRNTMYDCPAEHRIPVFLISFGAILIIRALLLVLQICVLPRLTQVVWLELVCFRCSYDVVSALILTIYSIVGINWLLHIRWPNMFDKSAKDYCVPTAYFALCLTVFGILFTGLVGFISFCCLSIHLESEGEEDSETITNDNSYQDVESKSDEFVKEAEGEEEEEFVENRME